jgi:hypothetical protein
MLTNIENNVLLSHYKTYRNKGTDFFKSILEGEIYELYCYNSLVKNLNDIQIFKAKVMSNEKFGHFYYSNNGQIYYQSQNIILAEFDVLGIKEKNIYSWEITKTENNKHETKKKINRKIGLLNILFRNYTINFKLIMPKNISGYEDFDKQFIPEPDYNKYINNQYFKLDNRINNCINVKLLEEISTEYNYLDEIIKYSKLLFNGRNINLDYLKRSNVIEYLYDIDKMNSNNFEYYDIQKEKYGKVICKNKKFYRDGKKTRGVKIRAIIKELCKAGHFA